MQTAVLKLEKTKIADYWDLTKPGITFLVVVTALAGNYLAAGGSPSLLLLMHSVLGIAFLSGGGGVLNHYIERNYDVLMNRTRNRPIPSGRIHHTEALIFGIILSISGIVYLAIAVNILTCILGTVTLLFYIAIYTPLKRKTPHSTLIGAFPGAMPPLLGWISVTGTIHIEAIVLFAIVFFWQMPHFLGIAWMYRKDYEKGGFPLLPVVEPDGKSTGRMAILYCTGLIPISLMPTFLQLTGTIYFFGALISGVAFLYFAVSISKKPTNTSARYLVLASVLYLPLIMFLLMTDAI